MNVSERDIFNFVFFNDILSSPKRRFIEKNKHKFQEIAFYQSLQQRINSSVDRKTKVIIAQNIPIYKLPKVIKLFPINIKLNNKKFRNLGTLMSKSDNSLKKETQTFTDSHHKFLIRIVRAIGSATIHLFQIQKELAGDIKLILHPGERHFFIKNKNKPIIVPELKQVESIVLELH